MLLFKNNYIIICGGIQEITRERDDVSAFDLKSNKWIILQSETIFNRSLSPKKLGNPYESEKSHTKTVDKSQSPKIPIKRDNLPVNNSYSRSEQSKSNYRQRYNK